MRTVYRPHEKSDPSGISGSARPLFFTTGRARARVFKTLPLLAANKSHWLLERSAKMWGGGGDTWSGAEKKCVCGEKMRMWTCPDDMYALLGERGGGSTSPNKLFISPKNRMKRMLARYGEEV